MSQEVCHSATAASESGCSNCCVCSLAAGFRFHLYSMYLPLAQNFNVGCCANGRPLRYREGPHMRNPISIDFPASEMEPESAHVVSAVSVPPSPLDSERGNFVGRVVYVAWISISCMLPPDESFVYIGKRVSIFLYCGDFALKARS